MLLLLKISWQDISKCIETKIYRIWRICINFQKLRYLKNYKIHKKIHKDQKIYKKS